MIKIE